MGWFQQTKITAAANKTAFSNRLDNVITSRAPSLSCDEAIFAIDVGLTITTPQMPLSNSRYSGSSRASSLPGNDWSRELTIQMFWDPLGKEFQEYLSVRGLLADLLVYYELLDS